MAAVSFFYWSNMAAITSRAIICTLNNSAFAILFLKRPQDVTYTIVLNTNVSHYVLFFQKPIVPVISWEF